MSASERVVADRVKSSLKDHLIVLLCREDPRDCGAGFVALIELTAEFGVASLGADETIRYFRDFLADLSLTLGCENHQS